MSPSRSGRPAIERPASPQRSASIKPSGRHARQKELHNSGWYHKTSQAFAVFLPVKSVGVVGDGRRYEWVIALLAVETIDFMTARWAHLPYKLLEKVSNRIINELKASPAPPTS